MIQRCVADPDNLNDHPPIACGSVEVERSELRGRGGICLRCRVNLSCGVIEPLDAKPLLLPLPHFHRYRPFRRIRANKFLETL